MQPQADVLRIELEEAVALLLRRLVETHSRPVQTPNQPQSKQRLHELDRTQGNRFGCAPGRLSDPEFTSSISGETAASLSALRVSVLTAAGLIAVGTPVMSSTR